mgnify:CR=1 FL=1|jgi:hypothetical protein
MAKRPIFIPNTKSNEFVRQIELDFSWSPGFAVSQKQKSIEALHQQAYKKLNLGNLLEISTKSDEKTGSNASAFNLKFSWKNIKNCSVECFYQGSKIFKNGGPFTDLYERNSMEAKKDERIKKSGDLVGFSFFNENLPLEFDFYTWIYLLGLNHNKNIAEKLLTYDAFTDIEFNPKKSYNCQAYSAAFFVSLTKRKINLEQIQQSNEFKKISAKKIINNFQPTLL